MMGCGSLGSIVANEIVKENGSLNKDYELIGILEGSRELSDSLANKYQTKALYNLEELIVLKPDIVVEAAIGKVLATNGEAILNAGIDLVVLSVGGLADEKVFESLKRAAAGSGAHMYLTSGAIGGFDVMRTLKLCGEPIVSVCHRKAPRSLKGAPWFETHSLDESKPTIVFKGNASEAIKAFPKNVNVAVATALATVGVENTNVTIESVPNLKENIHTIDIESNNTRVTIQIANMPDLENPRSSVIAGWSLVALLKQLVSPVIFF